MKNSILLTLLLFIIISSCKKELTKEEDTQNLMEIFGDIQSMAQSIDCTNSGEWTFTSYGSKACGGPKGYIPYSLNMDVLTFLQLIETHRRKEREFNDKWGAISDCMMAIQPTGVHCKDGNPVLEY